MDRLMQCILCKEVFKEEYAVSHQCPSCVKLALEEEMQCQICMTNRVGVIKKTPYSILWQCKSCNSVNVRPKDSIEEEGNELQFYY